MIEYIAFLLVLVVVVLATVLFLVAVSDTGGGLQEDNDSVEDN